MNTKSQNFEKEITIKSSTENLIVVRKFVKDSANISGFNKDAADKIVLAVDEACTNIIKHAYHYADGWEIRVNIKFENSKFVVTVTDEGEKFDPTAVKDPDLLKYYKQKKVGGLGMFLMKKLMDEVSYYNLTKNRNQVVLVKYLN